MGTEGNRDIVSRYLHMYVLSDLNHAGEENSCIEDD